MGRFRLLLLSLELLEGNHKEIIKKMKKLVLLLLIALSIVTFARVRCIQKLEMESLATIEALTQTESPARIYQSYGYCSIWSMDFICVTDAVDPCERDCDD